MMAVFFLFLPLTGSTIIVGTSQGKSCWSGKLAAAGICVQRGRTCISVGIFLPYILALKHLLCLLTSEEMLSNSVCNT